MNINEIKQAIRAAYIEGAKLVPTKVSDLVRLLNYVELVEGEHRALEQAIALANDRLTSVTAQALLVPKALDEYA